MISKGIFCVINSMNVLLFKFLTDNYFFRAVRFNPKEPALYCNRAAAYNNLNKFNEAIQDCNSAISLNGSYAKAYVRRGYVPCN